MYPPPHVEKCQSILILSGKSCYQVISAICMYPPPHVEECQSAQPLTYACILLLMWKNVRVLSLSLMHVSSSSR